MYGIFKRNDAEKIFHHESKIDEMITKKRKIKWNFSKIISGVKPGNRPWDF